MKLVKESLNESFALNEAISPKDWDRIVGYYYQFYTNIMERLLQENGHTLPVSS